MQASICFLVPLTALVFGACSPRQQTSEIDIELEKQVIRDRSTKSAEAYRQRDAAGFASYFEDEGRMIWVSSDGEPDSFVGRAEIQRVVEEDYAANPNDVWGVSESDLVITEVSFHTPRVDARP